jgi:multicomponent Na+:H+ antiporter subunit B
MNSLILRTAAPFLVGLTVLFSIYVLLRGHNEPGGGFIGGLIGASAFATYAISEGCDAVRRALVAPPIAIAGAGLLIAGVSGAASLLFGDAFLTGQWWFPEFAPDLKYLSTVVLFDIGVYLVVIGAIVAIILGLEDDS